MEYFFLRLEKYIKVRPTAAMTNIIVKIMVEVLSILGIVTKGIAQGKMSMSFYVFLNSKSRPSHREVSQKASWNERSRGCASAARSIDARGGSHGSSGSVDDYSRHR